MIIFGWNLRVQATTFQLFTLISFGNKITNFSFSAQYEKSFLQVPSKICEKRKVQSIDVVSKIGKDVVNGFYE